MYTHVLENRKFVCSHCTQIYFRNLNTNCRKTIPLYLVYHNFHKKSICVYIAIINHRMLCSIQGVATTCVLRIARDRHNIYYIYTILWCYCALYKICNNKKHNKETLPSRNLVIKLVTTHSAILSFRAKFIIFCWFFGTVSQPNEHLVFTYLYNLNCHICKAFRNVIFKVWVNTNKRDTFCVSNYGTNCSMHSIFVRGLEEILGLVAAWAHRF